MSKKLLLIVAAIMIALNVGCYDPAKAKKEAKEVMDNYTKLYEVLMENKDDPEAGLKAGWDFVNGKKASMMALAKSLNSNIASVQIINEAMSGFQEDMQKKGQELAPYYGQHTSEVAKIIDVFSQSLGAGNEAQKVSEGQAKQVMDQTLSALDQMKEVLAMVPEDQRAAKLDELALGLKEIGASEAILNEFKSKAKEKLGW